MCLFWCEFVCLYLCIVLLCICLCTLIFVGLCIGVYAYFWTLECEGVCMREWCASVYNYCVRVY